MILQRKIAPEFRGIDNINLIHPEHQKLSNGCNVFCFNSGDQELVRIEWIFGNLRFDPEKPLLNTVRQYDAYRRYSKHDFRTDCR